MVVLVFPPELF